MPLTDDQITEGLRLAGEATPGPWRTSMTGYSVKSRHDFPVEIVAHVPGGSAARPVVLEAWLPNAALIAHAGTHYAAALAEVQALRGQVRDALAECESMAMNSIHGSPLNVVSILRGDAVRLGVDKRRKR